MRDGFDCANCKAHVVFSPMLRAMWSKPQPCRCQRCGTVHGVMEGEVEVISPFPLPVGEGVKRMPWMLPQTRPIKLGIYEVRFRSTEPRVLRLYWCGRYFRHEGKRVDMSDFLSWRGDWL